MECLKLSLYIATLTITLVSGAVPKDICDTCVRTQDCPLFENLSYHDQLIWMETYPCGSFLKTNKYEVPAGFASAAKGDYVCCSNNIWGIEKPDHFTWNNYQPNRPANYNNDRPTNRPENNNYYYYDYNDPTNNNLDDRNYSNLNNYDRNNTLSTIWFPDWKQNYYPATNKPDMNFNFYDNNQYDKNNSTNNNLHTNDSNYEVISVTTNNGSTIWFPDRRLNYVNNDYWLTHDPRNHTNSRNQSRYWNFRPDRERSIENTERPPADSVSLRNTNRPNTLFYYSPGNTERPTFRNTSPINLGNPNAKYPSVNIYMGPAKYYPPEIVARPDDEYNSRDNIFRPPISYNPPRTRSRQYFPPTNIGRTPTDYFPTEYMPRQPIRSIPPYTNNIVPRQPFINNPPRPRDYIYDEEVRRNDNSNFDRPYNAGSPYDFNEDNFGGGQCARLTSLLPNPQSDCCGRQVADDDRITGRFPSYNSPAFTNHWERPSFRSGPIWRTRREINENSTDENVTVERRISGGQATELYQYPWTVLLLTTFDYGNREAAFNCGGSLISAKYVLTAGHCVYDKGASVKSVQVILAEYDKRSFPKDCKSTRSGRRCVDNIMMYAEQIITHPQYENENLVNDIALLRLQGTAPYTEYIRSICLPSFNIDEPQFSNLQFEVAGWGRNGQFSSNIKQSTFLHLVNHNQCRRYYPQLTDKHLCAAGQRGADTCKGDSGGPLMILYRGRYYVAGIVSGKRADSPCGTAVPSLYTNVYHYVDWIRRNVKN